MAIAYRHNFFIRPLARILFHQIFGQAGRLPDKKK
jgi:hypothetical protein